MTDTFARTARTSSMTGQHNCISCGRTSDGTVTLQETDDSTGATLTVDVDTFTAFLTELKRGDLKALHNQNTEVGEHAGSAIVVERRKGDTLAIYDAANPQVTVITTITNFDKFVLGVCFGEFDDITDPLTVGAGVSV